MASTSLQVGESYFVKHSPHGGVWEWFWAAKMQVEEGRVVFGDCQTKNPSPTAKSPSLRLGDKTFYLNPGEAYRAIVAPTPSWFHLEPPS